MNVGDLVIVGGDAGQCLKHSVGKRGIVLAFVGPFVVLKVWLSNLYGHGGGFHVRASLREYLGVVE